VDVQRPRRQKALRRALAIAITGAVVALAILFVSRLEPRQLSVERAVVWTGKVEKSPFVVRVRGSGTLRPESIRWLTSESSGRVEEVLAKPGIAVELTTEVVRLENLDLRLLAVQAAREVQAAEALVLAHERQSQKDGLDLGAELVQLRAALSDARRRAATYAELEGAIVSRLEGEEMGQRVSELEQREVLAVKRLTLLEEIAPRQLLGLERQAREVKRVQQVREQLVERLTVRAGARGILQDVLVELGQWVVPGTPVAKVIVDQKLQAELRIPADQAGRISVGQAARVRTGFGHPMESNIAGRVRRVAPAAHEGTVAVEIALEGELPDNARPDQSVVGSIETERTDVTVHVARPVGLSLGDTCMLFRVDPTTQIATRVQVRTGRISVDAVEVLSGLEPGDEIILSDMSRYVQSQAVRLE
jgi:HlyD family secretion protein